MKKKIIAGVLVSSLMFTGQAFASDYVVKSGDSLWKIASNNEVTINELRNWNGLTSDVIFPGQSLLLKPNGSSASTPNTNSANTTTYTIKSGDTLTAIAKNYQTTVSQLLRLNTAIKNENQLFVGQKITVPGTSSNNSTPPTQAVPSTNNYTIKSGDSLSTVAKLHGVSLSALLSANPTIKDANRIFVGQVVIIPSGGSVAPVSGSTSWQVKADAIIESGKRYLGASYLYGAATNRTDAFDCSSFTMKVYQENGINLPRTSTQQANVGKEIPLSQVRKGDLIFFDTSGNGTISHVSIVVDANTLLHSATSTGVAYASLNSYWKPRAVKAVRVL